MAGSYQHVLSGFSLLENMGDAHEAIEELFWLVQAEIGETRALQLLDKYYYPMKRGEMGIDKRMRWGYAYLQANDVLSR